MCSLYRVLHNSWKILLHLFRTYHFTREELSIEQVKHSTTYYARIKIISRYIISQQIIINLCGTCLQKSQFVTTSRNAHEIPTQLKLIIYYNRLFVKQNLARRHFPAEEFSNFHIVPPVSFSFYSKSFLLQVMFRYVPLFGQQQVHKWRAYNLNERFAMLFFLSFFRLFLLSTIWWEYDIVFVQRIRDTYIFDGSGDNLQPAIQLH